MQKMGKMSIKLLIYKVLYLIIHNIYTVLEFGLLIKNKFVDLYHELVTDADNNVECLNIQKNLKKVPIHVTILLGIERPSHNDLANIILWCLTSGISFVSFYDYKGILKKQESELMYEVEKRKPKECHIIWHNNPENTYRNGFAGKKIHVKLLSVEDGKCKIVEISKQFGLSGKKDISEQDIHMALKKYYEFPDPDLGIYCGKTFSLFGYPPWQIRTTEFLNIISHHNIKLLTFMKLLDRYSKCEQRLGK